MSSEGAIGAKTEFGNEAHLQFGLENDSGNEIILKGVDKRKEAINYIDKALENGDPVVAGVHYKYRKNKKEDKKSHNEGTTDHYLVIIGSYYVNGTKFYSYWDVGSQTGKKGKYYFELKSDFTLVSDLTYKNRYENTNREFLEGSSYIVTQIRRNKHYILINEKKKHEYKKY